MSHPTYQTMVRTVLTLLCFFVSLQLIASDHTERGWKLLTQNKDSEAIKAFEQAIDDDDSDVRAHLGLCFAYELRLDDVSSWKAFKNAIEAADDAHPYLYASVLSRRFQWALHQPESGLEDLLKEVASDPDPSGILQAMAFELLGSLEERRGNMTGSVPSLPGVSSAPSTMSQHPDMIESIRQSMKMCRTRRIMVRMAAQCGGTHQRRRGWIGGQTLLGTSPRSKVFSMPSAM
jgi:tetratricopeptide (TPR) repeat protein